MTEIRLYPRIKSFINGGYRYNPVLDAGYLRTMKEARNEYLVYLGGGTTRPLGSLIGMRARLARMEREARRRLVRDVPREHVIRWP